MTSSNAKRRRRRVAVGRPITEEQATKVVGGGSATEGDNIVWGN